MGWQYSKFFKTISRVVLITFYFQTLHVGNLGYHPGDWGLNWHLGFNEAAADDSPQPPAEPTPQPQSIAPDDYLSPTPDANSADPYIIQKAQELGNDPNQIFAFVRDEIGYESYKGSLRGARGTLWSKAGNSLDKASLMIALLRASGIEARYAEGVLSDADAQKKILSMFPVPLRILGCLDTGVEVTNPATNSVLLDESRNHYWVEFGSGGFQDADPSFEDAVIGQAFTSPLQVFSETPDSLRHKTKVVLKRELTIPAVSLFGGGSAQSIDSVFEKVFNTVELVGRHLSLGHFINTASSGFVFSAKSNTYSPYIIIGDIGSDSTKDELIRGNDYTEVLTDFPFGNQIVTGLFLEIDLNAPDGSSKKLNRTLADRIGWAARKNAAGNSIVVNASESPLITGQDIATFSVMPSEHDQMVLEQASAKFEQQQIEFQNFFTTFAATPEGVERDALLPKAIELNNKALISSARGRIAFFERQSDLNTQTLENMLLARSYWDHPRVTIVTSNLDISENNTPTLDLSMDLIEDDPRVIPSAGQATATDVGFRMTRGFIENGIEAVAMDPPPNVVVQGLRSPIATYRIFEAAKTQGIDTVVLNKSTQNILDTLNISTEAKIRIGDALVSGNLVIVPGKMVDIDGRDTIGWYEQDLQTGQTQGVLENGTHGAIIEYFGLQVDVAKRNFDEQVFFGYIAGATSSNIVGLAKFLWGVGVSAYIHNDIGQAASGIKQSVNVFIQFIKGEVTNALIGTPPAFQAGFVIGFSANILFAADPPIGSSLVSVGAADEFKSLPNTGVAIGIIPDPLFSVPQAGAQLPTVFRAGIKNNGATTDTFALDIPNIPEGFTVQTSVAQITLPPGKTAEVSICLRPMSGLPSPGNSASFTLNVNSSSTSASDTETFIVPEIHGLGLSSSPSTLNATPGVEVPTMLELKSVGNVPENVDLSANLPTGLALNGLNSVNLATGQTIKMPLTFTPAGDTSLNTKLTANINASFGTASFPQTQTLQIPVFVAAPGAQAIADASLAVGQLGKADLANRLNDLSMAMNRLVQNTDDPVAKSQALAALDSIIKQLTADPFLSEFVDEFTAAKQALEAAGTADEIVAALNGLGSSLNGFGSTATQLGLHNFEASLAPPSIEAQPNVPAPIGVRIRNTGSSETTYNVSFENLPADTSGAFTQTSVTLLPGQISNDITASLTRTAGNELLPASFKVRVTAGQAPAVSRLIEGNLTVRNEFISVASVTVSPPFVNPRVTPPTLMFMSAKILNAVNRTRNALVSFKVKNSNGQEVFASSPVSTTLSVQTALTVVDLGAFNPQGLPEGTYTAEVSVTDSDGTPVPGGTGTGKLLLGSPVTASLINTPDQLPPGNSTVTQTLKINSQLILPPLSVEGQIHIPSGNLRSGVAVKDNIAYACSANGVQLFDLTDPAQPVWLKAVGSGVNIGCKIQGDLLLTLGLPSGNTSSHILNVYSLKNDPLTPVLLGSSPPLNYNLQTDLVSNESSAFVAQFSFCNFIGSNDIFTQTGDLLSIPLNTNDPIAPTSASPALADVLFNTYGDNTFDPNDVPGCAVSGGDGNVWQLAVVDENTLLVATTTIKGTDTQTGVGRVLVIDTSDPANLSIVKEVQIPGTAHVIGIAVDGDRAMIVSSTGGWRDFFSTTDPNNDVLLTGNLVFSTLLLTDPRNPILLGSQSLSRQSRTFWNGGLTSLGNGRFAYSSLGGVNDAKQILMIDANDPFNLVFGQTNVPAENIGPNAITANGELIYTTNAAGDLIIYRLPDLPIVPVKASVKVPKNTGVTLLPGSFTEAPSEIIQGNDFDTLVWERNLTAGSSLLVNWQALIDNLQPGEARQTAQGGTVDFTFENTPGQVPLNPTTVISEQLLALDPATQTVHPGETAFYNLTVKNPAASPVSYALSIQGIPPSWAQLDNPLLLEANEERTITLPIAVESFTATGLRSLVVTALGDNGARGAVQGDLVIEGDPFIPAADSNAHGVIMSLTPANATAGQGTSARYTVRVINTGSSSETFRLDTTFLPANFVSVFDNVAITVPPGASNYRDVGLTVTPPADTPPTDYPFSVQAVFEVSDEVGTTSQGLLTVVNAGVSLAFDLTSGNPGESLFLNITNTGSIEDEFMLSLLGPGGLISSLSDPSVRLLPGASTTIGVTLGNVDFALPGGLSLFARATSTYDDAVQALAKASINVAERRGLSASLDPAVVELAAPGSKNFLIKVKNTGNVEDAYSATISQVTGPVSASLEGFDGNPVQTIPVFRLPALADGSLTLSLNLNATGTGTVKVLVASSSEPSIQQELTAQLGVVAPNQAPIADAGQNKNVFTGTPATLDGSASNDPDGDLISYLWRFISVPAGSALDDIAIVNRQTSTPQITPDLAGIYKLELIVSDGLLNSLPAFVELTAANANVPPNAEAGLDQTVSVGETAVLDGSSTQDPDGGPAPLSFNWSFTTLPALSGLDNASIATDPQNPAKAYFTPDVKGSYELNLRVSDGEAFDNDALIVNATQANVPPVANAGDDLVIQLGDQVNLNAVLSHDPDQSPSPLSFGWKFVSLPQTSGLTNSAIVADSQNPAKASFTPDQAGDYVLTVEVSDGEAIATDNILVKVLPALRYQDISDLFRVTSSNEKTVLNRQTRKMTSSVTLTLNNISAFDVKTPVRVMFGLPNSAITIPGSAIDPNSGQLYLELPANLIQPGGTEVLNVQFVYPAGTQFRYDTRIFGKVAR